MLRLQFESSDFNDPSLGVGEDQIRRIIANLNDRRSELINHDVLLGLPKRLHSEYEQHREQSQLGNAFRIANGLHDHVDALVVVGSDQLTLATKALFGACCDPYHNELSRAARGSKPRIYFAGRSRDNDSMASLLHRLQVGQAGESSVLNNWALFIAAGGASGALTLTSARLLLEQHAQSSQFLCLTSNNSFSNPIQDRIPSENQFRLMDSLPLMLQTMSPAVLVPAAFLGLDCMKLLGGAHEMSTHFEAAETDENLAIRLASFLIAYRMQKGTALVFDVRTEALSELGTWCEQLFAKHIRCSSGLNPRNLHHTQDCIVIQLCSEKDRWDPVFSEPLTDGGMLGCPTIRMTLPNIGMFEMGEVFQLMMIVERLLA